MTSKSDWLQDPTVRKLARANPLHGNPLRTRADLGLAVADLVAPLLPHLSEGWARIRLGVGGAHDSSEAAEMEAFARPLWGPRPSRRRRDRARRRRRLGDGPAQRH